MSARVLVVDDDPGILDVVSYALAAEGFEVAQAAAGDAALEVAAATEPDLVVLDLMLPGVSGVEVCRRLRAGSAVPIIMLTARDADVDKVLGLEVGADDYVTKPFSVPELVGRVRAQLRRRALDRAEASGPWRTVGPLRIDLARHEAALGDRPVPLTPSEFRLLVLLAERPGQVLSRRQIMERLWGGPFTGDERAADVHVFNLRRKLESHPEGRGLIVTVRGFGYRLDDAAPP